MGPLRSVPLQHWRFDVGWWLFSPPENFRVLCLRVYPVLAPFSGAVPASARAFGPTRVRIDDAAAIWLNLPTSW